MDVVSVIDRLIVYPLSDMMKLANSTSVWAYCHFLMFRVMFLLAPSYELSDVLCVLLDIVVKDNDVVYYIWVGIL